MNLRLSQYGSGVQTQYHSSDIVSERGLNSLQGKVVTRTKLWDANGQNAFHIGAEAIFPRI
jgi:hypothetical protein